MYKSLLDYVIINLFKINKSIKYSFEWDEYKSNLNLTKHGVNFRKAEEAFLDPNIVILDNLEHSTEKEKRYFALGKIDENIMTVRFTYRNNKIRIFGAGYWRKGKKHYEQENKIH